MEGVRVQILCMTYGHEAFIRQALDSFVMQKTNFPFEAIVAEDNSPDNTREIIAEYQRRYPHIIKPLYRDRNLGGIRNFLDAANYVTAKYVAICEGDDYWTDEHKLQKQVDALEAHPDCTVCFHPVTVKWEEGRESDSIFPTEEDVSHKHLLTFDDLKHKNFIQTNSVMYRWGFHDKDLEAIYPENILPGDWFLHLLHAAQGDILLLDDIMSVYRRWPGGLWAGAGVSPEWFCRCGVLHLNFFMHLEKIFPGRYRIDEAELKTFARRIRFAAEKTGNEVVLEELHRVYPQYELSNSYCKAKSIFFNLYLSLRARISRVPVAKWLYRWLKNMR